MKVLIAGKGSYVGQNIKMWLEQDKTFNVDELDMQDNKWSEFNFSIYDSIIHVAAIVHRTKENIDWEQYKKVNTILPVQVAEKAKASGVKQFIFLSTMGVYGQDKKLPHGNVITEKTLLSAKTYYGKSKLDAEQQLKKLEDDNFKLVIIRPPNIYGKDCPGNYLHTFIKMAKYMPIFPKAYDNSKQSLLYIGNLAELIKLIIKKGTAGVFLPQDENTVSTNDFIDMLAKALNKKVYFSNLLGLGVKVLSNLAIINKIYGGVSYSENVSNTALGNYRVVDLMTALKRSISS